MSSIELKSGIISNSIEDFEKVLTIGENYISIEDFENAIEYIGVEEPNLLAMMAEYRAVVSEASGEVDILMSLEYIRDATDDAFHSICELVKRYDDHLTASREMPIFALHFVGRTVGGAGYLMSSMETWAHINPALDWHQARHFTTKQEAERIAASVCDALVPITKEEWTAARIRSIRVV